MSYFYSIEDSDEGLTVLSGAVSKIALKTETPTPFVVIEEINGRPANDYPPAYVEKVRASIERKIRDRNIATV